MIIWRGYGFLVFIVTIVCVLVFGTIFNKAGVNDDYGAGLGLIVAGIIIWFLGKKFNNPEKSKVFIDKESGREVTLGPGHSLFFIKMEYWGIILPLLGVVVLVYPFLK